MSILFHKFQNCIYMQKLIINEQKNKSKCNKKHYQKISHIQLKTEEDITELITVISKQI